VFALFGAFVEQPALALIPAGAFALLAFATGRRIAWATAAVWAFYALLEALNKARITCSGECNIRVDLLLIAPALLGLSALTLVLVAVGWWKAPKR
jgi:hypothetical protein